MSRESTLTAGSTVIGKISTLEPVVVISSSKTQNAQTSTSSGASSSSSSSSQSSQSSPSAASSSSTSASSTTTDPGPSDSTSNSPVASSSTPSSSSSASSNPSVTLRASFVSAPNVPAASSTTVATSTSPRSQALIPSGSQSSPQASTGGVSFFHNKTAMIAVFASVGVFVLVVVLILVIVALRWKRRKNLIESALDFSPTTQHLVPDDDYSRGGSTGALISRSSGSWSSEARGTRPPRVPSVVLGAGLSVPALAPAPIPVSVPPTSTPAPREMQQRGFGTGYIGDRWLDRGEMPGARYAYGNSAQPYYDAARQQQPPPQQQQQLQYQQYQQQQQQQQQRRQRLQYQPQQQPRPLLMQQQEERPLPRDLPTDVDPIPPSLMPSSQRDAAVFNVPFAATAAKPARLSIDGGRGGEGGGIDRTWGSRTSTRERRQTQQVPLPPSPMFPRKIPDTLGRNDERLEDNDVSVDEDRRNGSRVLKVVNG